MCVRVSIWHTEHVRRDRVHIYLQYVQKEERSRKPAVGTLPVTHVCHKLGLLHGLGENPQPQIIHRSVGADISQQRPHGLPCRVCC